MPIHISVGFPDPPRIPAGAEADCLRDLNRAAAENLSNSLNHSGRTGDFQSVDAALAHAGYETKRADDGALEIVGFNRERYWEEEDLFHAIAKHLDGPATIRIDSESDEETWMYEFDEGGVTCEVEPMEPDGEEDEPTGPRA